MQSEIIPLTLTATNVAVTLISIAGIIHILQEKFMQPKALKEKSKCVYYILRGSLASLAAVQLVTLSFPVSIPLLLVNLCTAAISTIVTKNF
jgi:hypothetical protein